MKIAAGLFLLSFFVIPLSAQSDFELDSLSAITQLHYAFNEQGEKTLKYLKRSHFDSNQILIYQERRHYAQADSAQGLRMHYRYHYNPETQLGQQINERIKNGTVYKSELTKFKSYDHNNKYRWKRNYNTNNQLTTESESRYNEQGLVVYKFMRDHSQNPKMTHIEEVERNSLGLMTRWVSFDDDGSGRNKVREMTWTYQNDSILLKNEGYVFNNWNETVCQYHKKMGELQKTTFTYGYRQTDGTIIRNHKNVSYFEHGQKIKMDEYEFKKKIKTHEYSQSNTSSTEKITGKGLETIEYLTQKSMDDQGRLLQLKRFKNGQLEYEEQYTYQDSILSHYTEIKHRENGNQSSKTVEYNVYGNPIQKVLSINNQVLKVDEYFYEYRKD